MVKFLNQAPARRANSTEITSETRGRKHCPAAASDRPEPQAGVSSVAPEHRPTDLRRDVPTVPLDSESDHCRYAAT